MVNCYFQCSIVLLKTRKKSLSYTLYDVLNIIIYGSSLSVVIYTSYKRLKWSSFFGSLGMFSANLPTCQRYNHQLQKTESFIT